MELKIENVAIPQKISFNYEELKQEIIEKSHEYEVSVYTEDSIKDAKADRANLNKLKKALNDERIKREKEYLAPFNEFKAEVNDLIAIIDKPIASIDEQIKGFEQKKKDEKYDAIVDLWNDSDHPEWLQLEQIYNAKWLNATVSLKKVGEEIALALSKIAQDIDTLSNMGNFAFESIEVYKSSLDMTKAINEGKRLNEIQMRKEEQERIKKEQEEKRKAMAQELEERAKEQEEQAEPIDTTATITDAPKGENKEPEKQWIGFKALLSQEDARKLGQFLKENNIVIKKIDL